MKPGVNLPIFTLSYYIQKSISGATFELPPLSKWVQYRIEISDVNTFTDSSYPTSWMAGVVVTFDGNEVDFATSYYAGGITTSPPVSIRGLVLRTIGPKARQMNAFAPIIAINKTADIPRNVVIQKAYGDYDTYAYAAYVSLQFYPL